MNKNFLTKFNTVETVKALRVTEEDYDGYSNLCSYCLKHNVSITDRIEKLFGNPNSSNCIHEDDGYCMKKGKCVDCVKLGYIKQEIPDFKIHYPLVGDYLVLHKNGHIEVLESDEFEKEYFLEGDFSNAKNLLKFYNFCNDINEMQTKYKHLVDTNTLTKQKICGICIPFKQKYGLKDAVVLDLARTVTPLNEVLSIYQTIKED